MGFVIPLLRKARDICTERFCLRLRLCQPIDMVPLISWRKGSLVLFVGHSRRLKQCLLFLRHDAVHVLSYLDSQVLTVKKTEYYYSRARACICILAVAYWELSLWRVNESSCRPFHCFSSKYMLAILCKDAIGVVACSGQRIMYTARLKTLSDQESGRDAVSPRRTCLQYCVRMY